MSSPFARVYSLVRVGDRRTAEIAWDSDSKSVSWFKLRVREAFNISDGYSFHLQDGDGGTCVVSAALPPGEYSLVEQLCVETLSSLVTDQRDERAADDDNAPENFEQNLLRIACADAMIANERTYLAWTRTSLSIMTCCFTFTFLDDWSVRPLYTKVLSNLAVVLFALAFLGCFLVGYVRYRMFARLLRTSAFSSSFSELDVDWAKSHYVWVVGTGLTLAFSSFVFLGVLNRDIFSM